MKNILNVHEVTEMLEYAIKNININQEYINSLNVFPVPDGDTGVNVYKTMSSAFNEIRNSNYTYAYEVFNSFYEKMLFSSRGNSGVIHALFFKGLAVGLNEIKEITPEKFAQALHIAKEETYGAVLVPQEGTILTISRFISENIALVKQENFEEFFADVSKIAFETLERTPEFLPVLKEVGVVDSGATALCYIFDAFNKYFNNEELVKQEPIDNISKSSNQTFETADIKYKYCTEFLIILDKDFDRVQYISQLETIGDSIVAIELDGIVKSHVHTSFPNKVIEEALKFGSLNKIKIDNMEFEHSQVILSNDELVENEIPQVERAFIAVSNSKEMNEVLRRVGVNIIIDGGQSKNPSTQDFVDAIKKSKCKEAIIFPNNSNVFMSASQTIDLVDSKVEVIKTRSVVQAYSIMLVASKEAEFSNLVNELISLLEENSYGEITKAVRDTKLNNINIQKNDFLGIYNKVICSSNESFRDVLISLLEKVLEEDKEVVTLIKGKDITKKMQEDIDTIIDKYEQEFDLEFDVIQGNQELYQIILGAD